MRGAEDEYDGYVGRAYVMLMDDRASTEEIAAYLHDIATRRMGAAAKPWLSDRCERTAAALIGLRPHFELH